MSRRVKVPRGRPAPSRSSDDDSGGEDVTNPKRTGNATRVFDAERGSFLRLKKKSKIPINTSGIGGFGKSWQQKSYSQPILSPMEEKFEIHLQAKSQGKTKHDSPIQGNNKPKGDSKMQRQDKPKNASQLFGRNARSPSSIKSFERTPVNRFSSESNERARAVKRKSSPGGNDSSSTADLNASGGSTPKKIKLSDKRYTTPTSSAVTPKNRKHSKTPNSNKKGKLNRSNNSNANRNSNSSQKSRFSGGTNKAPTFYAKTPEYMRVKEDDSVLQEKRERKRIRNKIMTMKTKRGQPVMRGRIHLMLDKIKADLNVS